MRFRPLIPLLTYRIVFGLVLLLWSGQVFGQDRTQLLSEQEQLKKKIELTNRLLQENQSSKINSLSELKLLQTQVQNRRALVRSYEQEVKRIKKEHQSLIAQANQLKAKRDKLMGNYQHLLQASYRSKLIHNKWLFLLSAASFHQVIQRWRYLKQVNGAWRKQIMTWKQANELLAQKAKDLNLIEREKSKKLSSIKLESQKLSKDQKKVEHTLNSLQKDEKQLKRDLKAQQKSMTKLRKAIERAVANTTTSDRKNLPLTPALRELANTFEESKGGLPWPVTQGIIARKFGTQAHALLPNIKVKNNGIDIETLPNSKVNAIFAGEVIAYENIPGFQQMVIVAHGDYYSVYSNLKDVMVHKGEKIKSGETLGFAQDGSGSVTVHLEIWKGKAILNPQSWLQKN